MSYPDLYKLYSFTVILQSEQLTVPILLNNRNITIYRITIYCITITVSQFTVPILPKNYADNYCIINL